MAVVADAEVPPPADQADVAADSSDADQGTQQTRTNLVFIDSAVDNIDQLVADFSGDSNVEVVLLDADRDGIDQITEVLAQRSGIESLHIVSDGSEGKWNSALTTDADLLIYGSELAATEDGRELVDSISALTGVDVVASEDLTGLQTLGDNEEFEYTVGDNEANVASGPQVQATSAGAVETIMVDATQDIVNGDITSVEALIANDGGDGISLREAIIVANLNDNPNVIELSAGTHFLTIQGVGGADEGDLDITTNITINGATDGSGSSTIDAGGATGLGDRVFHVQGAVGTIFALNDLTVEGGFATGNRGGGAVRVSNARSFTADSVIFDGNEALHIGGAISSSGNTTLTNSFVIGNQAAVNGSDQNFVGGGGLFADAGQLIITNSTFDDNVATERGGGIYIASGSATHELTDVTITNNRADEGGGLYHTTGSTTATGLTVTGNNSTLDGGGIFQSTFGSLALSNSTVQGNTTDGTNPEVSGPVDTETNIIGFDGIIVDVLEDIVDLNPTSVADLGTEGISLREAILATNSEGGAHTIILGPGIHEINDSSLGGLLIDNDNELTIIGEADGSTIIDATGLNDRVFNIVGPNVEIRNVTIQGGTANDADGGGGILVTNDASVTLDNVFVTGNTAPNGGGIRNNGTLTITNSKVNGNTALGNGGGILNAGNASLTVNDVVVAENTAGNLGGGIRNNGTIVEGSSDLIVTGNVTSGDGGGISNSGSITVDSAIISNNTASNGFGGGIHLTAGSV